MGQLLTPAYDPLEVAYVSKLLTSLSILPLLCLEKHNYTSTGTRTFLLTASPAPGVFT